MTGLPSRRSPFSFLLAASCGEAVGRVAQILGMALAGRLLGPGSLGAIALAWSLTVVAQGLVQGGPDLVGIRLLTHAAGDAPAQARLVADISRLKLILAAAGFPLLFAVDVMLGHGGAADMAQLALQSLSMTLVSLNHGWAFRGLYRPFEQGWLRGGQALLALLLLGPLLLVAPSPLSAPASEILAAAAMLAAGRWRLARLLPGPAARDAARPALLRPALALGFAGMVAALQWTSPIFVAASVVGPARLGIFAAVFRLVQGLNGVFQIGLQSVYPLLSGFFAARTPRAGEAVAALTLQSGGLVLAVVLALAAFAEPLTRLLLGPGFAGAGGLFLALVPVLLPVALSSPLGYVLIARGDNTGYTALAVVSAAAMALGCRLSFSLLPDLQGALAVHLVFWGQFAGTLILARRRGLLARPTLGWRSLLDPRNLGRLLHPDPQ